MTRAENPVRAFLRNEIAKNPDPVLSAVERCGVSRKTVLKHLAAMRKEGSVLAAGAPRKRRYRLAPIESWAEEIGTADEDVARAAQRCGELCLELPESVNGRIATGLAELVQNARDHAGATSVRLLFVRADPLIEISISDDGPGLFRHLQGDGSADDGSANDSTLESLAANASLPVPGGGIARCLASFDRALWWSENTIYGISRAESPPALAFHGRRRRGTTARLVIDCRRETLPPRAA